MRKRLFLLATVALLFAIGLAPTSAQRGANPPARPAAQTAAQGPPEYGPAKGTLVIVGGGATEGTGIMEKFIELAGGARTRSSSSCRPPAAIAIADGHAHVYKEEARHRAVDEARTDEREDAAHGRSEGRRHGGVRQAAARGQRRLVRRRPSVEHRRFVHEHADATREFHKVLERGGVIGGSSAGATIQGDYLVRGDTSGPDVMMTRGAEPRARLRVPAHGRRSISTSTRATAGTT